MFSQINKNIYFLVVGKLKNKFSLGCKSINHVKVYLIQRGRGPERHSPRPRSLNQESELIKQHIWGSSQGIHSARR